MMKLTSITQHSETDVSHLIVNEQPHARKAQLVGEIEVQPHEEPEMSLGNFREADLPKGFSICTNPNLGVIATQMTSLDAEEGYELVLHVANHSDQTLSAEVWQLI